MTSQLLLLALLVALVTAGPRAQRNALLSRAQRNPQPRPPPSCSTYSSASCPSQSCSFSASCSMSVSWEESEVRAEIVRQRIKNPRHRLYYCPSSTSCSESCEECHGSGGSGCPTEYTTIEIIRPHVGRHHKRKVHIKEEVCSLSTEIEVIRKKGKKCEEKGKKPRYEIICKKKCEKKEKCKPVKKEKCKPVKEKKCKLVKKDCRKCKH